ncbi:hypothetical protein P280DRAFT_101372 [Massarina eburnea CBS 473.64]|uniref:DUF1711-domain-containing protein n=1 Tax=Massarina eburnea CBS 473.64 TaxID=1395130 RepID=A0A6A6RPT6_9PLEO|nr:hypothetical protein P280DRAFT_101372 [Massarina eburnea CBS 473.64]
MSTTKSKVVVLSLPRERLAKFPHDRMHSAATNALAASSDTPAETPATVEPTATDNGLLAPPAAAGPKRKAGTKRGASALDSASKPRGKPGPKSKKQKLGDMINDPNHKGPFATPAPIPKLGPKANLGTINANLRALDRTGKPCRKWEKKGFMIRSFTGVAWGVPTWRAPKKSAIFSEDVKSDSTGSSDTKVKDESSAISDKSGALPDSSTPLPMGLASSPIPAVTAS